MLCGTEIYKQSRPTVLQHAPVPIVPIERLLFLQIGHHRDGEPRIVTESIEPRHDCERGTPLASHHPDGLIVQNRRATRRRVDLIIGIHDR